MTIVRDTDRPLQPPDRLTDAAVHSAVEQVEREVGVHLVALCPVPEVPPVDGLGIREGQGVNVQMWVAALGDAELRFTARVVRVEDVPALVVDQLVENLVEGHLSTLLSSSVKIRLKLSRISFVKSPIRSRASCLGRYV